VPDLLAHYAVSYLVASRVVGYRWAVLVAFIGLAPDLDVLVGFHRWVTHSVVLLTGVTLLAALLVVWRLNGRGLSYLALAFSLYTLHILMDMLTGPTPILWPVGGVSYAFNVKVDGLISQSGVQLEPSIAVIVEPVDFTRRELIEGPLVSTQGAIIALGLLVALIAEAAVKHGKSLASRDSHRLKGL